MKTPDQWMDLTDLTHLIADLELHTLRDASFKYYRTKGARQTFVPDNQAAEFLQSQVEVVCKNTPCYPESGEYISVRCQELARDNTGYKAYCIEVFLCYPYMVASSMFKLLEFNYWVC